MKVKFVKPCGHHSGIEDVPEKAARQYIAGGYAISTQAEKKMMIVSGKLSETLVEAGYETIADIYAASDEDLLAISGIGKSTLEKIRNHSTP